MNSRAKRPVALSILCALLIVAAAVVLWKTGKRGESAVDQAKATAVTTPPSTSALPQTSDKPKQVPAATAAKARTFDTFQARPFAVVKASGSHEWTAEDGKTPDAILDLAHNESEVDRLMEENGRIKARQLVYRREPAFEVVQRARTAGEPVKRLTVPGLDGQELEMEVTTASLDPSGLRGTFAGRLPGKGLSMVTLAFKEGREAFSVMSPEDGTYLQGHPREPGEIIVTSYDPEKYLPTPGGEPIKTTVKLPIRK